MIRLSQPRGRRIPRVMMEAQVPVVPHWLCRLSYGDALTGNMFCGGHFLIGGVSSCQVMLFTVECVHAFSFVTLNISGGTNLLCWLTLKWNGHPMWHPLFWDEWLTNKAGSIPRKIFAFRYFRGSTSTASISFAMLAFLCSDLRSDPHRYVNGGASSIILRQRVMNRLVPEIPLNESLRKGFSRILIQKSPYLCYRELGMTCLVAFTS